MYRPEPLVASFEFIKDNPEINNIKTEPEVENETESKDCLSWDENYHIKNEEVEICDEKCNIILQENASHDECTLKNMKFEKVSTINDANITKVENINNVIQTETKQEKDEALKNVGDITFVKVVTYSPGVLHQEMRHPCPYCRFEAHNEAILFNHIAYAHVPKGPDNEIGRELKKFKMATKNETSDDPMKSFKCTLSPFTANVPSRIKEHSIQVHLEERKFRCPYCDYAAKLRKYLNKHIACKHEDISATIRPELTCHLCGEGFLKKLSLEKHMSDMHLKVMKTGPQSKYNYTCDICGNFKTNYSYRLRLHKYNHNAPKCFKCEYCPFKSKYKLSLTIHVRDQHIKEFRFKCSCCEYKTNFLNRLNQHVNIQHNNIDFHCTECGKFSSKFEKCLNHHLYRVHGIHKTSVAATKRLQCDLCSFTAKKPSRMKEHQTQVHSDVRNFPCPYCSYAAKVKRNLKKHILVKHKHKFGIVRTSHVCHICGKELASKCALKTHMDIIHLNVKPKCTECDYQARHGTDLRAHILMVHHPEDLYMCHNCGYSTPHKTILRRHIIGTHLQPKNKSERIKSVHVCHICQKELATKFTLNRHIFLVHNS